MFDYRLSFEQPVYYAALGPDTTAVADELSKFGRSWRWAKIRGVGDAALVILLLSLALAKVQIVRESDRVCVMLSHRPITPACPATKSTRSWSCQCVERDAPTMQPADAVGVIVFGREAAFEVPPLSAEPRLQASFETFVDAQATNLAEALRLAQAAFPPDSAKRIVIISDGNENIGRAYEAARGLAEDGIGIDVVPIARQPRNEVSVEKVVVPSHVRQGVPFDVRVVLNARRATSEQPIRGMLRVSRTSGNGTELLVDQPVVLEPGKQVFSFRQQVENTDFYSYEARFVADDAADDAFFHNNEATAFSRVEGRGQLLFIEDWAHPGQFDALVEQLRNEQIEVTLKESNDLFANLDDLQRYDAVVLADVPRTSGDDGQQITEITDRQIELLVRNTQQMGSGLVMLGGPNSFGAGGWANTQLEQAMPIDFRVKNPKIIPTGALMLVIDISGSMDGDKMEMSRAAAIAAIRVLGEKDFVGVVGFNTNAHWYVPMQSLENRARIARAVGRMSAGGGTFMMPALEEGYGAIRTVNAAVKHVIVLTDGQTDGEGYEQMAAAMRVQGITTTCVGVGEGAALPLLNRMAAAGGGKFYHVRSANIIPRIFIREAMQVSRPLVFQDNAGIATRTTAHHEILGNLSGALPAITGYVMSTPKENPLVELLITADRPSDHTNPVLASWRYGLGRAVALTTDTGQRWAGAWVEHPETSRVFSQSVRWALRPADGDSTLSAWADIRDGQIDVVVTALDTSDEFLNFLQLNASAVGPDLKSIPVRFEQTAPGRYTARVPATSPGSYFLAVDSGQGAAPLRLGVHVPNSAEFDVLDSNQTLLSALAGIPPRGGSPGQIFAEPTSGNIDQVARSVDPFRRDLLRATSRQHAWHLLALVAGCLFFFDVFSRRVMVDPASLVAGVRRAVARWRGREMQPAAVPVLLRLQASKQAVREGIEKRTAARRFEPDTSPSGAPKRVAVTDDTPLPPRESSRRHPTATRSPSQKRAIRLACCEPNNRFGKKTARSRSSSHCTPGSTFFGLLYPSLSAR